MSPADLTSKLERLRPAKVHSGVRRRSFEYRVPRTPIRNVPGIVHMGSDYGGWMIPAKLIEPGWTCYLVGAGGDVSFDLELIREYGATVRSIDAVENYVERAREEANGQPGFTAVHAAVALKDGPIRMQVTHDPRSQSVSAARLYDSDDFIELPGRTLPSLMAELGDRRIDLLKVDIEGSEYEVLPTLDLGALGVKVFATQLHHTDSVKAALGLIANLREQGYDAIACRSAVKLTFARRDLI
jgi:FkbM family methyltransferase